jgi:hypothetical protein
MRFDFACFALCAMTIEEDLETDLVEHSAEILSFHTTVLDAMTEQTHHTELLRTVHKLQYSGMVPSPWSYQAPKFKEPQYQLVPIQQMRFNDLSSAQEMIESAAILQQEGVGV